MFLFVTVFGYFLKTDWMSQLNTKAGILTVKVRIRTYDYVSGHRNS
jgi:hypothetical protein